MPLQGERLRDYALQEHAASLQGVWSGYAGYVRYIVSRGPAPLGKLLLLSSSQRLQQYLELTPAN